jgi:hypothetical protein
MTVKKLVNTETVHIHRLELDFTIMANKTAEDPNLSWKAKGLLWYLSSRPKDWSIHTWQLAQIYEGDRNGGGIKAIRNIIQELIDNGYVTHSKSQKEKGYWHHRYDIYPTKIPGFKKVIRGHQNGDQGDFKNIIPNNQDGSHEKGDSEKGYVIPSTELPSTEYTKEPSSPPLPKTAYVRKKQEKGKSLRSELEEDLINKNNEFEELMKSEPLVDGFDKDRLSMLPFDQVKRAITVTKNYPPRESRMGQIMHAYKHPENYTDESTLTPNQKLALNYNNQLRKVKPKLAEDNDVTIMEPGYIKVVTKDDIIQYSLRAPDFIDNLAPAVIFVEEYLKKKGL